MGSLPDGPFSAKEISGLCWPAAGEQEKKIFRVPLAAGNDLASGEARLLGLVFQVVGLALGCFEKDNGQRV